MNRSEIISKCSIAAFAALSIAGSAFAAESAPAANAQCPKPAAAASSEKCPAWNERESLFIQGAVEKYAPDSGFSPFVTWTGEAWADVSRGSNVHLRGAFPTSLRVKWRESLKSTTQTTLKQSLAT